MPSEMAGLSRTATFSLQAVTLSPAQIALTILGLFGHLLVLLTREATVTVLALLLVSRRLPTLMDAFTLNRQRRIGLSRMQIFDYVQSGGQLVFVLWTRLNVRNLELGLVKR